MKITIQNTNKYVILSGVNCRVWEGETETGVKVACLITRIAASAAEDLRQFDSELKEQRAPSPELDVFPLRMIL